MIKMFEMRMKEKSMWMRIGQGCAVFFKIINVENLMGRIKKKLIANSMGWREHYSSNTVALLTILFGKTTSTQTQA